ncbi:MAG: hypothetical protein HY360_02125 [Verrucomicrobia bacterium]|nr:hypothetical protein [Verrucomicrobiota bacterium]
MIKPTLWVIEKPAGPADAPPADAAGVEKHRREVCLSYENFLRKHLADLDRKRPSLWSRDYSSVKTYEKSVKPMRLRLQRMLGFWIEPTQRSPLKTGKPELLLETPDLRVLRFRLEILPRLETYGLELIPLPIEKRPGLLVQHGYGGTPELVCGLTPGANGEDYSYRSLGIRAARHGFHVVSIHHPSGYGNLDESVTSLPGFEQNGRNYGKNRLHRMAIMGGGTLFGLDMMGASRGIDLLAKSPHVLPGKIGMYGLSQGGQSALFLPALDVRIQASVSSAYFNWRFPNLIGPHRALSFLDSQEEDKFFSEVISCFSDCDIVSLIAPRAFAVEAGQKDTSVDFEKSQMEFERAQVHYKKLGIPRQIEFIPHAEGHISATARAFEFLKENLFR